MSNPRITGEKNRNPWSWIPSLYFTEGLPFAIVTMFSVIMFKRLGISNADIGLYTGWLYLPWVIKPLWSPLVDILKTKRFWIYTTQLLIGAGMAGVAFTIPAPDFFQFSIALFWLIAFSSATQDIAVDGFYMLALPESQQSIFIGLRNTFHRVAIIAGQSLLILLAGYLESTLTVSPVEFQVIAKPSKFFEETIKVDSSTAKQLPGKLRLIANPSYVEISTRPKKKESVDFYVNFAHNFNIMNGFVKGFAEIPDTTNRLHLVGNIGIVKFFLSKQPSDDEEYLFNLNLTDGSDGIKVIEGNNFTFNSKNWNKPAFAVLQLDSTIAKRTEAVFIAQVEKVPLAWMITMIAVAVLFILFFIYHRLILPRPVTDIPAGNQRQSTFSKEFFRAFARFFEKKKIILTILFLLFFRFGEAQLAKLSGPFLLDERNLGGLGLSTTEVGFAYSTLGTVALLIGGILGGIAVYRKGLKFWLWPMLITINLPSAIYIYLAYTQPENIILIFGSVAVEQFCFGFGFTAYIMYMIYLSQGEYKTSHYAIAAGFMALGLMIPGMISGIIEEAIGYKLFFIWLIVTVIPSIFIIKYLPLEYQFGKKKLLE